MIVHRHVVAGEPVTISLDVEQRFWEKVNKTDTCWLWTAYLSPRGYGHFVSGVTGSSRLAHRISYELLVGKIPDGLVLDHLCRVPACVNPSHLEPVTNAENIRRGVAGLRNKSKTRCPRDHEYTPENTVFRSRTRGGVNRVCRICDRALGNERMRRHRART
jgi:hypothetical protein